MPLEIFSSLYVKSFENEKKKEQILFLQNDSTKMNDNVLFEKTLSLEKGTLHSHHLFPTKTKNCSFISMSDNHIFNDLTKRSGNLHKLLYVLLVILHCLILSHEQGTNELKAQNRPKMGKFGCINI